MYAKDLSILFLLQEIFRSCFLGVIYSMTTVATESFYIKSYSVTQCKSVHPNVHVSVG